MRDYYKILGVKKKATEEEIRARWAELVRKYHPDHVGMENSNDQWIKEINEAYDILKHSSTRVVYDLKMAYEWRKKRKIYIKRLAPLGLFIIPLIFSIVYFKRPQMTSISKAIIPNQTNQINQIDKIDGIDQRDRIDQIDKKNQINQISSPPKSEASVKIEKAVPKEVIKTSSTEVTKVIPKEMDKIVTKIEPPLVLSSSSRGEPKPDEMPSPKIILKSELPVEVEMVSDKERSKLMVQEIGKREETKQTERETKPVSVPPPHQKEQITQKEVIASKPIEQKDPVPVPAPGPPMKVETQTREIKPLPLIAKEEEVRQFFINYIDRYIHKNIESFISFFSSRAIQNQKDNFEGIRKIYKNFFNQSKELHYHFRDMKIEISQEGIEVRAEYVINQILKREGERKVWYGQIRWTLGRENGVLKILSLDYQYQKSL